MPMFTLDDNVAQMDLPILQNGTTLVGPTAESTEGAQRAATDSCSPAIPLRNNLGYASRDAQEGTNALMDRLTRERLGHATSSPIRIASPSPHRLALRNHSITKDDKLDIEKVQKRAMKKNRKRDSTLVPQATHTVRGFQTPGTSCGEESDVSGASTPVFGPMHRNVSSVSNSPALRPLTPQSGVSSLKLQLDALSLNTRSPPLRSISMQRTSTSGSRTTDASDSEMTEMDTYEVQLDEEFVSTSAFSRTPSLCPEEVTRRPTLARKMTADDFEPLTCLGKGSYGTVILVRHRDSGRLFAQKQLKKASLIVTKKLVEQTKTERVILETVNRHPFVVKLFYAFQDHEKLYLILEYAQGGELFHHLKMERMFSEDTTAFYMAEMVLALEHLHRNVGVVYRDLKPENCLLDSEGHLLLTDFGLSKVAVNGADKCNTFMGTIDYMAPEIIQGKEYGKEVDWWSFGALGFDLLTGSPPFSGNNNAKTQQKIVQGKLIMPYYLGPDAKDLFTRLLRKDRKKRLGANMPKDLQTIKNHRFFRKIDWTKLAKRELEPPVRPVITDPELAENFSADFTGLSLSPTVTRKNFDDELSDNMDMSADPFGGFSYVASSSLLDEGMLD